MSAITALFTASIFAFNPAAAPVDPFAAETAVDPLSTAVPSAEGEAWTAPSPPPLPPPPRRPTAEVVETPYPAAAGVEEAPSVDAAGPTPVVSADAAKRTITTGLILLGGSVAAAAGSVYSWREQETHSDQLRQQEQANKIVAEAGGFPTDTSGLRDDIKLYRGLTIGLAVTAGVLAVIGGGVALAGLRRRERAAVITMRAGGVGVQF
jgi:hypothetical protein